MTTIAMLLSLLANALLGPVYAQDNPWQVEITRGMKRAMLKNGPRHQYRISEGQIIHTHRGDLNWQRLYWRGR